MKFTNVGLYEKIRSVLNGGIFADPISKELAARENETVLDFGCGTGTYSQIIPGKYFGLDTDSTLVTYARMKYGSPQKIFLYGSIKNLMKIKRIKNVAKVIIINVLHHLNDEEVYTNLDLLKKIVKKRLIIVDMDKGGANLFQKFLYLFDNGHYIRDQTKLMKLIQIHFEIKKSFIYFSSTGSVRLCLFHCVSR